MTSPPEERILRIVFESYWHCGSGRAGGEDADAVVERDAEGFPYVPGRHLKGVLRQAVRHLEVLSALTPGTTAALFGADPQEEQELARSAKGGETSFAALSFGSARLPAAVRRELPRELRNELFAYLAATAIDEDTGVAKERTLRRIEVVVPLELRARISLRTTVPARSDWARLLEAAFPLVTALGAHRSRGLGRVRLAWQQEEAR